jgi:hypothetical protein
VSEFHQWLHGPFLDAAYTTSTFDGQKEDDATWDSQVGPGLAHRLLIIVRVTLERTQHVLDPLVALTLRASRALVTLADLRTLQL